MVDFSQVIDILLGNTPVEQVSDSRGNVLWSSAPVVLKNYFYVEDASGQANTLRILKGGGGSAPTVEVFCSTDRVNWTSMGSTSTTPITATVPANGKLYLKANTERFGGGWDGENNINCNASFNVGGNIMSMLNGDNFEGSTFAPNTTHNFGCMFKWSYVVDASNLVLPDTVTSYCYWGCFYGCTSLTTAPALPATIMAEECYNAMFNGCGSLTSVPATLPATTLANNCYFGMFDGCASLTTAPVLPATTLATGCYSNMFKGCSSLTTAPVLPATTMANNCYQSMFYGCSSLTTTPALPATTLANNCYAGMFWNCGSLTSAPATLPVTTLYAYCYANMFNSCGSLTTAPELPATTLTSYCYHWMFQGCSRLNRIVTYAQDISAESCLNNWLGNVAATGDFYNNGEATYTSGASGIPTGWTEHTPVVYNDMILQFAGGGNTTILGSNANISDFDEVYYYDTNNVKTTINSKTVDFTGLTNVNVYYKLKQLAFTAAQLDNALPNGNYYGMPVQSFYNVPITKIIQFDSNTEVIPSSVFRGSSNISLECELPDSVLSVGSDSFNTPMTLLNTSRFVFGTHCGYIGKYVLSRTKSNMTHILVRCNMTDNGVDSWFNSFARFQNESFDMVITNEVTYIGIYLLSNFQGKVYMESTTPPTLGTPVGTINSNMQMIVPVGSLSAYQTAYGNYITNIVEGTCPYPTR